MRAVSREIKLTTRAIQSAMQVLVHAAQIAFSLLLLFDVRRVACHKFFVSQMTQNRIHLAYYDFSRIL